MLGLFEVVVNYILPLKSKDQPITKGGYCLDDVNRCLEDCLSVFTQALTSNGTKKPREMIYNGIPLDIPVEDEEALLELLKMIFFRCQLEILFVSIVHFTKDVLNTEMLMCYNNFCSIPM